MTVTLSKTAVQSVALLWDVTARPIWMLLAIAIDSVPSVVQELPLAEWEVVSVLPLRVILVIASVMPMWVVEGIMRLIFPTWNFGFGGWMELMAATIMAMATAVWHESSQE